MLVRRQSGRNRLVKSCSLCWALCIIKNCVSSETKHRQNCVSTETERRQSCTAFIVQHRPMWPMLLGVIVVAPCMYKDCIDFSRQGSVLSSGMPCMGSLCSKDVSSAVHPACRVACRELIYCLATRQVPFKLFTFVVLIRVLVCISSGSHSHFFYSCICPSAASSLCVFLLTGVSHVSLFSNSKCH